MAGNVLEWCMDVWDEKPLGGRNPVATGESNRRVLRGGGWHVDAVNCRSSLRNWNDASARLVIIGFRVVCLLLCGQDSP